MKRPQRTRSQVGGLLQGCTRVAERVGMMAARKVLSKLEDAKEDGSARRMADIISKGTDKLIAQSPVPIPGPLRDALDSMRVALGQLSSSIDVVNAGAASLSKDPVGVDPSRRRAMDDARAAFVGLDAGDDDTADATAKRGRRNRPRRSNHRSGDARPAGQTAQDEFADKTPNG